MNGRFNPRRGFTIVELMVVVAVIVLVVGLLLPALNAFRKSGLMTRSMGNMRQIAGWMALYAGDNRDVVVPSRFNYSEDTNPGNVRSVYTAGYIPVGEQSGKNRGTWADILWTVYEVGVYPLAIASGSGSPNPGQGQPGGGPPCPGGPCSPCHDFRYDSPDHELYCMMGADVDNPLRSAAPNTRHTFASGNDLATPYGCGAHEKGDPGYFAANDFFNADKDARDCWTNQTIAWNWHSRSQIRGPDRSMYLVDSVAGEVIAPKPPPFQYMAPAPGGGPANPVQSTQPPVEVDFRYAGVCLMLYLDSHIGTQTPWADLAELQGPGRGVRVQNLTSR